MGFAISAGWIALAVKPTYDLIRPSLDANFCYCRIRAQHELCAELIVSISIKASTRRRVPAFEVPHWLRWPILFELWWRCRTV